MTDEDGVDVVEAIDAWIDEQIDDLTDDELEMILELLDAVSASSLANVDADNVYDADITELVELAAGSADDRAYNESVLRAALFHEGLHDAKDQPEDLPDVDDTSVDIDPTDDQRDNFDKSDDELDDAPDLDDDQRVEPVQQHSAVWKASKTKQLEDHCCGKQVKTDHHKLHRPRL